MVPDPELAAQQTHYSNASYAGVVVRVPIRQIFGPWQSGFVLDKHMVKSIYVGDDAHGRPRFESLCTEVGQAVFELKYRGNTSRAWPLAQALMTHLFSRWGEPPHMIIPMPPSTVRRWQPVLEVARRLGQLSHLPVLDRLLTKSRANQSMKNLSSKAERVAELSSAFHIAPVPIGWPMTGCNALVLDDLFDTGATLECACRTLRSFGKLRNIYVAALTSS